MRRLWFLAALCALFYTRHPAAADEPPVRAWQASLRLPTYRVGEASPSPQFAILTPDVANYPYPLLKNLTKDRQDRGWRTLNLENEYLLCRVLPDLGGHLYSCRDKRNGREMFYANPVMKPGDIGLRGAWAALGIESNFPVGHTRVSISPVDFAVGSEPDGSGRVVVEDIDRVTGMQWRVEFILYPGSTVLEQRVTLYNGSPARQPYYWWANAGVAFDDPATRMILPVHVVSTHTTPAEIVAWPVTVDGKDGTIVANHKSAGAWFALASREPFFAVYKPGFRSGLAHYADPGSVAGKKLWIWGTEQDAWVKRELTDNFPSYVEMQGGLFQNQDTFEFLLPEQSKVFSEFWIPVCDLGDVTRVTRDAILNLQRRADPSKGPVVQIELSATKSIPNASIRVLNAGKPVFETRADLSPSATYSKALEQPADAPYTIQLKDSAGATLLEHIEGRYDSDGADHVKLGTVPKPYPDGEAEDALLARGNFSELRGLSTFAWSDYSIGLRKFPSNFAFVRAAGNFALNLNRFDDAASLLSRVVAADASDAASVYGLGLAQAKLGQDAQARQTLSKVPPSSPYGSAAALQLALLSARAKKDADALGILERLSNQPLDAVRKGALEVALLRRSGRKPEALQRVNRLSALDPADNMLRFERGLLGGEDLDLPLHLTVDSERVLNLVDEYLNLGSVEDALRLLSQTYPPVYSTEVAPGNVPVALDPLILYYRAYCRAHLGQNASADLRAAAAAFTRYIFPNRWSSVAVLNHAIEANPSDARARLLLGRLLLSQMRLDEAIGQWQEARKINPALPELARDLGRALIEGKKDAVAGMMVLREGLKLNPADPELRELATRAGENLLPPEPPARPAPDSIATSAATSAKNAPPRIPNDTASPSSSHTLSLPTLSSLDSSSPIGTAAAAMLKSAGGKVIEADSMFSSRIFSPEKQPDLVRQAWIEVQLQKLISLARSGKCMEALDGLFVLGNENTGLAFTSYGFDRFMKLPHFQYYMATIESTCHEDKKAAKRWTGVSKMAEPIPSPEFAFPFLAAARLNFSQAQPKVAAALETVRAALAKADPSSEPSLVYLEAMVLRASGKDQEAVAQFQEALKSGGPLIQYLALIEINQMFAAK